MQNCNSYANVCRLCLKRDIQIYSIKNTYLEDVYEKITSIELNSIYIQSLCYICMKRLKQCHKLIEQAVETDKLLKYALWCGVETTNFLENTLPGLLQDLPPETRNNMWLQNDGCPAHYAISVRNYLNNEYPDRWIDIDKIECVQTFTLSVSPISTMNISLHPVENDIKEESAKIKEELKDNWDNGINAVSDQIEEDQIDQKISTGSKETYSIDGLRAYEDVKDISDSDDDGPLKNICLKIHSETKQDSVKNKKFRKFNRGAFHPLKLPNKEKANEVVKVSKEGVPEIPNLIQKDSFLINSNNSLTEPHVTSNPKIHSRSETLTLNETKPANNINLELPKTSKIQINDKKHDSDFLVTNNKYICNICNYETVNKKFLIFHLRLHDTKEKIHCCSQCQYMTNNKNSFNTHLKKHTGEKPYECHICQRKFSHIASLNRHKRTHTGEKPYECHICQKKFSEIGNLNRHKRTHTGEKPYECHICQRKFSQSADLNKHIRTHTGEKLYECHICQRKFSHDAHLKDHIITHTGEKPYECHICQRKFVRSAHLKNHRRTHIVEKPYECHICQKKFSEIANLNRHKRTHTVEKPYECHICQRKFSRSDLNTHIRTHTGEKPYECNICQRKFSRSANLKDHIITHTGEKPYECHICQRKFSRSADLNTHIRTHTGEKPYECHICQRKFSRSAHLKDHIITHTGEKPYECLLCPKKFTQKGSLNYHLRTLHTEIKQTVA